VVFTTLPRCGPGVDSASEYQGCLLGGKGSPTTHLFEKWKTEMTIYVFHFQLLIN
jgi:hypothetical protein